MAKHLSILIVAVICIGAFVMSAGCLGSQENLEGTSWVLVSFGSEDAAPASIISLNFGTGGSANGNGGVNGYNSAYTIDPSSGKLTFSAPASTMMAGPQSYMTDETRYFSTLQTVTGYKVENGNLLLTGSNGAVLLTFAPALVDSSWKLVAYTPYDTNQLTTAIGLVSLNFEKDGKYNGNTGINQVSGTWSLENGVLTISEPAGTRMTGLPRLSTQEDYIRLLLPSTTGFNFGMGQLRLTDSSGKVILTFTDPLADSNWILTQINGAEPYAAAREVTLNFEADGTLNGNAPVNTYTGKWTSSGANALVVSNVVSTQMAGLDANINSYESDYYKILNDVSSYRLSGTELILTAKDGKTLTYKVNLAENLKGTTWYLAGDREVTLVFSEDGTISGKAKINTYHGPVVFSDDNGIAVGTLAVTLMSGTPGDMSAERTYLSSLEDAKSFDVVDGQLLIKNVGNAVVLTFNP